MCGRNPAHYAEYWKAVQELWLQLYQSNLVLVSAINVSVPTPRWPRWLFWASPGRWGDTVLPLESLTGEGNGWGDPEMCTHECHCRPHGVLKRWASGEGPGRGQSDKSQWVGTRAWG